MCLHYKRKNWIYDCSQWKINSRKQRVYKKSKPLKKCLSMFKIKNFNIKRRLSFPLWLSTDFKEYVLTQNITEIKRIIKHFIKEIIVDKEQVKIVLNLLSFLMGEITEQLEEEKMIVEREELYTQLSKKYIRKRS